jgi:hypothetical protein
MTHGKASRSVLVLTLAVIAFAATGCGYVKNLRDDFLDLGTFAVGYVPAVVPGEEGEPIAVGVIPPAFGLYFQFTEFLQFGALYKITGDLAWDRRGVGALVDKRAKIGFGPFHYVNIEQKGLCTNDYKILDGELAGWHQHMDDLRDPVFNTPAKIMVFDPLPEPTALDEIRGYRTEGRRRYYLTKGWQDWETTQLELAVPLPCLLHSGFYLRAGFDCSQLLDFALGLVCIDFYSDAAYKIFSGEPKY